MRSADFLSSAQKRLLHELLDVYERVAETGKLPVDTPSVIAPVLEKDTLSEAQQLPVLLVFDAMLNMMAAEYLVHAGPLHGFSRVTVQ